MKRFTRTIEDFTCQNCGRKVLGNGYTNHCPDCLWSRHVDVNPGDRSSLCQSLMEPIGFDAKKGILHKCRLCKIMKYNKVRPEDNREELIALSAQTR